MTHDSRAQILAQGPNIGAQGPNIGAQGFNIGVLGSNIGTQGLIFKPGRKYLGPGPGRIVKKNVFLLFSIFL